MSAATDELTEVLTNALVMTRLSDFAGTDLALIEDAVEKQVAALVSRYGEPEIEGRTKGWLWTVLPPTHRRLVFPWQAVKEGDEE